MTIAPERIGSANREAMARWTAGLHDVVTAMFERLDGDRLVEASWERKGGGGGQSRLLTVHQERIRPVGRPTFSITASHASMQRPHWMQPSWIPSRISTPVGQTATHWLQSMQ